MTLDLKQVLAIDAVLHQTRCPVCSCHFLVRLCSEALLLACQRCGHSQEALVLFKDNDTQEIQALIFT